MNPKFLDSVIAHAEKSEAPFKLGAVIANGKRTFWGWNSMDRTHPLGLYLLESKWIQVGVHAEMEALIKAKQYAEHGTLVVARVLKDGTPAMAKPCPRCRYLIKLAGVKEVFYTTGVMQGHPYYALEPRWERQSPVNW
jgi:deoxycytidylate deaminase